MIVGTIVVIALIFFGLVYLKLDHHTRKIKIIALILAGFFIYFSITAIFSSNKIDFSSPRGIVRAVYLYFGWVGHTLSNLWDIGVNTVHTVGNAVKINESAIKK